MVGVEGVEDVVVDTGLKGSAPTTTPFGSVLGAAAAVKESPVVGATGAGGACPPCKAVLVVVVVEMVVSKALMGTTVAGFMGGVREGGGPLALLGSMTGMGGTRGFCTGGAIGATVEMAGVVVEGGTELGGKASRNRPKGMPPPPPCVVVEGGGGGGRGSLTRVGGFSGRASL